MIEALAGLIILGMIWTVIIASVIVAVFAFAFVVSAICDKLGIY